MNPNIVLLHGWGSHPHVWRAFARTLRANAHMPALPGYAGTPVCEPYTLECIVETLATAAPKQCIVVGWSLGEQVALTWARRFPRQVQRLVLIAATPSFAQRSDWPHAAKPELLRQFTQQLKRDAPALLRRVVALQSQGETQQVRVAHKLRTALFTHAPPLGQALAGGLEILRTADLRASLSSIAQPALVIHGAQDAVTPCDAGRALARLLPRATLHVMQGTGHAPFLSDGDGVAALIHAFCTDQKVDHE